MKLIRHKQNFVPVFLALAIATSLLMLFIASKIVVEGAPTSGRINASTISSSSTDKSSSNSRVPRASILSSLFRRQINTANEEGSNNESDSDDPQSQTEMEAQKFMDSLPNPNGNNNNGPSTFRERVSDTFGVLRDGIGNHFKSIRDNFSDTVEDLRETWSE